MWNHFAGSAREHDAASNLGIDIIKSFLFFFSHLKGKSFFVRQVIGSMISASPGTCDSQ
jgi:hypothetical protein